MFYVCSVFDMFCNIICQTKEIYAANDLIKTWKNNWFKLNSFTLVLKKMLNNT